MKNKPFRRGGRGLPGCLLLLASASFSNLTIAAVPQDASPVGADTYARFTPASGSLK
jgi:hypothetical protein